MTIYEKCRENRIVIIGNSGSGKSWLSERLAGALGVKFVDLDRIHWIGDGHGNKREPSVAIEMVSEISRGPTWVVEGVYGWLAEVAAKQATTLIWLDVPWKECEEGLLKRGFRRSDTKEGFRDLLSWAGDYWRRQGSSSFEGHLRLYQSFTRKRYRLQSRAQIGRLARTVS